MIKLYINRDTSTPPLYVSLNTMLNSKSVGLFNDHSPLVLYLLVLALKTNKYKTRGL
jgi:hypothetical protein